MSALTLGQYHIVGVLCAALSLALAAASVAQAAETVETFAQATDAKTNKAPAWARGSFVYRISTPDEANVLPTLEAGLTATSNLLDGGVRQIPFVNGFIGHDHRGMCNWDGLWPYWGRVTFRAQDWKSLATFMTRVKERANTAVSFHVNLTDVNVGLRDYPEGREFFRKLVETRSIYRRDHNKATNARDQEPPYVPKEIPTPENPEGKDPIGIFALVNYKQFWDSGLGREMIDEFYGHLPYPPPLLYLDVLNLSGGNFSTGYPTGPLGGSQQTQLEGECALVEYLRTKGTSLATEGLRGELGERATYSWLHGRGWSRDDYSMIDGGFGQSFAWLQVAGSMSAFNVSPVTLTEKGLRAVRDHYTALAEKRASPKRLPGLETCHIAYGNAPEFDIPGTGDPFRGDWADLINNFYLMSIQEMYHIGKGNVRTATYRKVGVLHITKLTLTDTAGTETVLPIADLLPPGTPQWRIDQVKKSGDLMLEGPIAGRFRAPKAGAYRVRCFGMTDASAQHGALNLYVNGKHHRSAFDVSFVKQPLDFGEITLVAGDNELALDTGPLYARWSDGTTATWSTPHLGTGLRIANGDVTYAVDYDRMWPDTWSGGKKIYFFSWEGTDRTWKLPADWDSVKSATLHRLTPDGRRDELTLEVRDRTVAPKLLPRTPYVLVPRP